MYVQHEFMFYEFKLSDNVMEAYKNICFVKYEGSGLQSSNQIVQEILLRLKEQTRTSQPQIVDSKAMLQALEANLVSNTKRVSGEFGILQSSVVCHVHDFTKNIWSWQIVSHKNF